MARRCTELPNLVEGWKERDVNDLQQTCRGKSTSAEVRRDVKALEGVADRWQLRTTELVCMKKVNFIFTNSIFSSF